MPPLILLTDLESLDVATCPPATLVLVHALLHLWLRSAEQAAVNLPTWVHTLHAAVEARLDAPTCATPARPRVPSVSA